MSQAVDERGMKLWQCNDCGYARERKSDVTTNEDPVDESLKNAIESEIKRKAKKERQTRLNIVRAMNRGGSGRIQNLPTFPIVVSQSPEDETQDQN